MTLPTRKAQALLAYLALRPGQGHPRDKLTALLLPDRGEPQARDRLRHTLVELRKVPPPGHRAEGRGRAVALDPAAIDVDVVRFETLVKAGTVDDLTQAAEMYPGDFLEGFVLREPAFGEWLVAEREGCGSWRSGRCGDSSNTYSWKTICCAGVGHTTRANHRR